MTAALLLAFFETFFQGGHLDRDRPGLGEVLASLSPAKPSCFLRVLCALSMLKSSVIVEVVSGGSM